ncbi:hypothetical protein BGZ54_003830, partial [Gamsiella multidivaricata]
RVSGTKVCDIHREIAVLVNQQCGTEWKSEDVRSNIRGIEKKYKDAHALITSTGEGYNGTKTLQERMYDICPLYDRLHQVYVSSVIKNPPPLKQSEPGPIPVPAASGDNFFASELDNDDDSGDASED